MLPQDPRLRGRLFQAGRALADWDQVRLAGEAGLSAAAARAIEAGRLGRTGRAAAAMEEALGRAGVQFIPAIGPFGPGLRSTPPGQRERGALGGRRGAA
jgi:DNA-binding XRE family transcriptional regulator